MVSDKMKEKEEKELDRLILLLSDSVEKLNKIVHLDLKRLGDNYIDLDTDSILSEDVFKIIASIDLLRTSINDMLGQIKDIDMLIYLFRVSGKYDITYKISGNELVSIAEKLSIYIFNIRGDGKGEVLIKDKKEFRANYLCQLEKYKKKIKEFEKIKQQLKTISSYDSTEIGSIVINKKHKAGYSENILIPNQYVNNLLNVKTFQDQFSGDSIYEKDLMLLSEYSYIIAMRKITALVLSFLTKYSNLDITKTKDIGKMKCFIYDILIYFDFFQLEDFYLSNKEKSDYMNYYFKNPINMNYEL